MTDYMKGVKIIKFDPEKDDYKVWADQFKAVAYLAGFGDVFELDYHKIPKSTNMDDKDKDLKEKCKKAFHILMLSVSAGKEKKAAWRIVNSAKCDGWDYGNPVLGWNRLEAHYKPTTSRDSTAMSKKFHTSKLTTMNRDPEEWISELEEMQL